MLSNTVKYWQRILLTKIGELVKCSQEWRTGNTKWKIWVLDRRDKLYKTGFSYI
jgi:hypothetical protein